MNLLLSLSQCLKTGFIRLYLLAMELDENLSNGRVVLQLR